MHYKVMDNMLDAYGINTNGFLKAFGSEMELNNICELKGDPENCKKRKE